MRENIEARLPQQAFLDECIENGDCLCKESEVRKLESDYAKLEARLGEAVELLEWVDQEAHYNSGFMYTIVRIRHKTRKFLAQIDKEKSDEV